MKRRDYYNQIKKAVDDGYKEYKEKQAKYNKLKEQRESGKFTTKCLNEDLLPKMEALRSEMKAIQSKVIVEVNNATDAMTARLMKADSLNTSELTDDAKLLQGGLILTDKDIVAILERSEGNRTMTQLALRYAKEHNIEVDANYMPASSWISTYRDINNTVEMIIGWYETESEHSYLNMYNIVFGDDSQVRQFCDTDDED